MVCVNSNKNATLKLKEEEGTIFGSGNESGDTVPATTEAVANDKRFYKRDETTTKIINLTTTMATATTTEVPMDESTLVATSMEVQMKATVATTTMALRRTIVH